MAVSPPKTRPAPQSSPRADFLRGRSLEDDVQFTKGVGPSGAAILAKMGIQTAGDLLRHLPRRYEDRTNFRRIKDLIPGECATVHGRVIDAQLVPTSRKSFTLTKVLLND